MKKNIFWLLLAIAHLLFFIFFLTWIIEIYFNSIDLSSPLTWDLMVEIYSVSNWIALFVTPIFAVLSLAFTIIFTIVFIKKTFPNIPVWIAAKKEKRKQRNIEKLKKEKKRTAEHLDRIIQNLSEQEDNEKGKN